LGRLVSTEWETGDFDGNTGVSRVKVSDVKFSDSGHPDLTTRMPS